MDEQLLRESLRSATATVDSTGPAVPGAGIRAEGDRRRRRRLTANALGALAVVVAVVLLRPGGAVGDLLSAAAAPPRRTTPGAVLLLGWLVVALAVACTALTMIRAWRSRRIDPPWWGLAAVALSASGALEAIREWSLWLADTSTYVLRWQNAVASTGLLVVVAGGWLLAGPDGLRRAPVAVTAVATALTGSVVLASTVNIGTWLEWTAARGGYAAASAVQLLVLVLVSIRWTLWGQARSRPWAARRMVTAAGVVTLSVITSTVLVQWLRGPSAQYLRNELPTPWLLVGELVLLALPTAAVCFSRTRRDARGVIVASVVAALVANASWLANLLPVVGFQIPWHVRLTLVAWTFGGAIVLWVASRVAMPDASGAPVDADDDGSALD